MVCNRSLLASSKRLRGWVGVWWEAGIAYRLGWKAIPLARELLLSNCGGCCQYCVCIDELDGVTKVGEPL